MRAVPELALVLSNIQPEFPETSVEEVYRDILKDDPEITGEQFEDMMKEIRGLWSI